LLSGIKLSNQPTEQDILSIIVVRPIDEHEKERRNQLIGQEHYLHSATLVGERMRYVAEVNGEWMALKGKTSQEIICGITSLPPPPGHRASVA